MSLSLHHADTFNRANGSLSGATMSDGVGAWTVDVGTWVVSANKAIETAGGANCKLYDSVMASEGDQKAEAKVYSIDGGLLCRYAGVDDFYGTYIDSGTVYLYKRVSGGSSTLATSGGISSGDVCAIEAVGTTVTWYVNGVAEASASDSDLAAGRCGMFSGALASASFDDFADYIDSGGGGSSPIDGSAAGGSTASGALTGTGAAAGSAAGAGATSGALTGTGALAGAAAGAATTAGAATGTGALIGTSAGEAAVVAALVGTGALAGSAAGVATVSGAFPGTAAPAPVLVTRLSDYRAQRLLDPMADRVSDYRAQRIHP